jgi:anti-anti-sigma regulatory factor
MDSQPTKEQEPADPVTLRIEGELTVFRATDLKRALLASPPPLEIDLSAVTEFDTAGLQLLMLARMTACAAQRPLRLLAPSAAVREVFELLNVSDFFRDPPPSACVAARAEGAARTTAANN